MTPEVRAHNLIGLLQDLVDVMNRENVQLETPRSSELQELVQEKQSLFLQYEKQLEELAANPGFAAGLSEEMKERLRMLSAQYEEVLKENQRRLQTALKTSDMIFNHISSAAAKAAGTQLQGYGGGGTSKQQTGRTAPIAINETL